MRCLIDHLQYSKEENIFFQQRKGDDSAIVRILEKLVYLGPVHMNPGQ